MKAGDRYFKYVRWSEEDHLYIGYCPDLFYGGACHSKEESKAYRILVGLVREEVEDLIKAGKKLPPSMTRPMREVELSLTPVEAEAVAA